MGKWRFWDEDSWAKDQPPSWKFHLREATLPLPHADGGRDGIGMNLEELIPAVSPAAPGD